MRRWILVALVPLYSILVEPVTITVGMGGAAIGDETVPVTALAVDLPEGTILDFGSSKFAKLTVDAEADETELATEPLPTALVAGDEALYQPPTPAPLLSEAFTKLTPGEQLAHHLRAEMLLGLQAPVYTGSDAEELTFAVVLQINHQVAMRSLTSHLKSVSTSSGGVTEAFRDRSVDPDAAFIVERVTGMRQVRYEPAAAGV